MAKEATICQCNPQFQLTERKSQDATDWQESKEREREKEEANKNKRR